jgi:hypothetical protein
MVEPTGAYPSPETRVNNAMRQTLADFAYYDICQGQSGIGALGYSSLPVNLVEAAFGQIQQLQTADPSLDLTNLNIQTCNNPTFDQGQPNTNYLTVIAPQPPACDKQGAGPCAAGVTPNGIGATPESSGTYPGSSGKSAGAAGGNGSAGAAGSTTSASGTSALALGASSSSGPSSATTTTTIPPPRIVGATLPLYKVWTLLGQLAPFAVLPLLLVFGLPVVIAYWRRRTKPAPAVQGGSEP